MLFQRGFLNENKHREASTSQGNISAHVTKMKFDGDCPVLCLITPFYCFQFHGNEVENRWGNFTSNSTVHFPTVYWLGWRSTLKELIRMAESSKSPACGQYQFLADHHGHNASLHWNHSAPRAHCAEHADLLRHSHPNPETATNVPPISARDII